MACAGTLPKRLCKAAGLAALLCTFVFADASSPAPAGSKSSKKPPTHKSAPAAHPSSQHSSSPSARSATSGKSKKSSAHAVTHKGKKSRKASHRGQEKIDSERTLQIQQALIKQHYLSGDASGKWDVSTEDALRHYQADNGWQNKTVPDSRALIKLGLGPSHDHLLNPESAMTTAPEPRVGKPASGPAAPAPVPNQPN